jgi:hypothetical protein
MLVDNKPMSIPNSRLFRNDAIKHYLHAKEKHLLPRFVPFPIAFSLWILLGLCLVAGIYAWNEEIPTYVVGPGIVLKQDKNVPHTRNDSIAAIFIEADQATNIRPGQTTLIQLGYSSQEIKCNVQSVRSGIVSPQNIQQTYGLGGNMVIAPSVVVIVTLKNISTSSYAGSMLSSKIQTGSQRLISFLPGVGNLIER